MPFWTPGFWSGDTGGGGSSSSILPSSATTANDLIRGALRFINEYAPGESLAASDSEDALETLNSLLDSLSTDPASIYGSLEAVLQFIPGQYRYTIGNYTAGTFSAQPTEGSPVLTSVTFPPDIVVGSDLAGTGIATGAEVVSFDTMIGTITMSLPAVSTPPIQQIEYTIPGDFKLPRPLRITQSFTRINTQQAGLDYPIEIVTQDQYNSIGYKAIGAPWPIALWYNPTMPLGVLHFYQSPSQAGELHLFTDTILSNLGTLDSQVFLPQGYKRMLIRMLARDLAPEYGAIWSPNQERLTKEAYEAVRSLNQVPTPVAKYDTAILNMSNRSPDASWILTGGFR
jgi:hypothetical protein